MASSQNNPSPIGCRPGCAACCIAPSISGPIPDLDGNGSHAKPAGVACVQLDEQLRCRLFNDPRRPRVCASLQPEPAMCGTYPQHGDNRLHALRYLTELEQLTRPSRQGASPCGQACA